ncbi:MAG: hypothetical protein M2R46_05151 [Verrucomicrobia subdivision 3 bacterium]|nr:hypothetical protein [Limisphaerales bacterium]
MIGTEWTGSSHGKYHGQASRHPLLWPSRMQSDLDPPDTGLPTLPNSLLRFPCASGKSRLPDHGAERQHASIRNSMTFERPDRERRNGRPSSAKAPAWPPTDFPGHDPSESRIKTRRRADPSRFPSSTTTSSNKPKPLWSSFNPQAHPLVLAANNRHTVSIEDNDQAPGQPRPIRTVTSEDGALGEIALKIPSPSSNDSIINIDLGGTAAGVSLNDPRRPQNPGRRPQFKSLGIPDVFAPTEPIPCRLPSIST